MSGWEIGGLDLLCGISHIDAYKSLGFAPTGITEKYRTTNKNVAPTVL